MIGRRRDYVPAEVLKGGIVGCPIVPIELNRHTRALQGFVITYDSNLLPAKMST